MSQDRAVKYLEDRIREIERRIKELTEELEILRQIASTLAAAKQRARPVSQGEDSRTPHQERVRVIYAEDEIIANEIVSEDSVKVVLRSGVRSSDKVVENFLLKLLEELKERGDLRDYKLRESGGYITQIDLVGPTQIALRQVEIALKYVWGKHASG